MMQKLRAAGQSWIAKTLFILLVGSFAVWGIGPIFTGSRVQTAATAGKVDITTVQVDEAVQLQIQLIQRQYGYAMTSEQAAQLGIRRQVAQQMVMQSLFDQEASKIGLRYNRDLIMQTIAAQPDLRDENGKFDKARFNGILQQLRMSEGQYLDTMRTELTRTVMTGALQSPATAPELLAAPLYQWEHEQRVAEVKTIKPSDVKDIPAPTAEELAEFHKTNSTKYMAPERRDFAVLNINMADLAKQVEPSEDELKQAYEVSPDSFGSPEKRTIGQVTTDDEAKAKAVAEAIAGGKSLKDATLAVGLGYGELADMTKGSTFTTITDAIFALKEKEVSPVIKSPMGWHVFELLKITPAATPDFSSVRDKVLESVRKQKAEEKLAEVSKTVQDALAGGATLAEVAAAQKLSVQNYSAISAEGKTADDKDASLSKDILDLAFTTNAGENSAPLESDAGVTLVGVSKIDPEHLRSLDEVRSTVTADWAASKQADAAEKQARELADKLNGGEKVASLTRTETLERTASEKDKLPAPVRAAIFNGKLNVASVLRNGSESWIVRPVSISRPTVDAEKIKATRDSLKGALANDLLEQFGAALRTEYGTTLNEAWLRQASAE
jgi:peptidyl-prolyl cis-trans isomerase D